MADKIWLSRMERNTHMKRQILAALLGLGLSAHAEGDLLAGNQGFEKGSLAGWMLWIDVATSGVATYEIVSNEVHSGASALKLDVTRTTSKPWQIQLLLPDWSVKPNTSYRLSFWVKAPAAFDVAALDVAGNYAWIGGFKAPASKGWTRVAGEIKTGGQSGGGKVQIAIGVGESVGTFHFDDMELVELGNGVN